MDREPTEDAGTAARGGPQQATEDRVVGESRWPMASAVVALVVMQLLLPHSLIQRPTWSVPVIEGVLLVAVSALGAVHPLPVTPDGARHQ